MVAAARPDVQASVLLHLADNYQTFDKKKAIECFKQAFTVAVTPPLGQQVFAQSTQMEIVVALTLLDPAEGIAMLKQMEPRTGYDNRSFTASRAIGVLLEKNQIQSAIDLADYMGSSGAYPFAGVSQIMAKLPPGDNQFAAVFSSALSAYTVKPDRSFVSLLMRYRQDLPAGIAQAALPRIPDEGCRAGQHPCGGRAGGHR